MALKVEIVRSEKREIDELDTKPFTMYVLNVVREVVDAEGGAPADLSGGDEDSEPVEVSLTKDEKGYGLGFDKFPTGVYVTRVVEGGVAHATGKIKEGQKFLKCGDQDAADMKKMDVVEYLKGAEAAQLTLTLDVENYTAGKKAKEAARNKWLLSRRYSQFNELKDNLIKSYPAVKSITFPPKVLLGNLQPKVIAQRTTELGSFVTALLEHESKEIREAPELMAFLEASSATVKEGMEAPKHVFTDISGRKINSDIDDEIVVFTAASRYNFQKLTEFIKPAQAEVLAKFPNVRTTFISVADLRIVPDKARSMVEPMLRKFEKKDAAAMISNYQDGGYGGHLSMEGYFCPDYSGETLKVINCNDANWTFRCFLCYKGRVFKSLQSSMQNLRAEYLNAVSAAVRKYPALAAPVKDEGSKAIQAGEEKVGARKTFEVEFDLADANSVVAFTFSCNGATEFHLSRKTEDGKEEKVLVSQSYKQEFKKRIRLGAGKFVMAWKPAGMLSASVLTYDVRQVLA